MGFATSLNSTCYQTLKDNWESIWFPNILEARNLKDISGLIQDFLKRMSEQQGFEDEVKGAAESAINFSPLNKHYVRALALTEGIEWNLRKLALEIRQGKSFDATVQNICGLFERDSILIKDEKADLARKESELKHEQDSSWPKNERMAANLNRRLHEIENEESGLFTYIDLLEFQLPTLRGRLLKRVKPSRLIEQVRLFIKHNNFIVAARLMIELSNLNLQEPGIDGDRLYLELAILTAQIRDRLPKENSGEIFQLQNITMTYIRHLKSPQHKMIAKVCLTPYLKEILDVITFSELDLKSMMEFVDDRNPFYGVYFHWLKFNTLLTGTYDLPALSVFVANICEQAGIPLAKEIAPAPATYKISHKKLFLNDEDKKIVDLLIQLKVAITRDGAVLGDSQVERIREAINAFFVVHFQKVAASMAITRVDTMGVASRAKPTAGIILDHLAGLDRLTGRVKAEDLTHDSRIKYQGIIDQLEKIKSGLGS